MRERFTKPNTVILPFLAIYSGLILSTAWVSDDAFITFRSIENFMHGYGLVYNVGERAQTFTHPLWMFMQSFVYALNDWFHPPFGLNQLFFWNLVISLTLSLAAVALYAFRVARSAGMAVLGLLVFSLSKAFVDYSTSGLENPLSHFLGISFFGYFLLGEKDERRYAIGLSFLAALATLNRMDTLLIYLPALGLVVWQNANKLRAILLVLTGFLPLVVWELFSLFYYGTPFPNTASAKLDNGIEAFTLLKQGMYYFLNSLRLDTITLVAIALTLGLTVVSKNLRRIAIGSGIVLYFCYILSIGGDFMSGRYFSLPLLVAMVLLSTFEIRSARLYGVSLTAILVIGLMPYLTTVERRPSYGNNRENNLVFMDRHKIADERLIYRDRTGLLVAVRGDSPKVVYSQPDWDYSLEYPREVHVTGAMGLNGYRDGPNIHVIDVNGLADPLIARMPLEDTRDFRIGHFHHIIPDGYEETLASGTNQIRNANIALYYEKLSYVVKGPLWDWDRLTEIWNLNRGQYDYLINN